MATATLLNTTVKNVRRTRRAYIGAHVMAFEFAQKRAALRLSQLKTMADLLVAKGEIVEKDAGQAFDTAKDKAVDALPFIGKADEPMIDVTPAKKTVKKAAKKASTKKMTTEITAKPVKTAAPKAEVAAKKGEILTDKYAPFQTLVTKYDADANPVVVKKIVDHLGIALQSRDGQFVACSDAAERETVVKSWLLKKLGVDADAAALDAKVGAVCDTMKEDRMKSRVTFYYLLAKNEGKLGAL